MVPAFHRRISERPSDRSAPSLTRKLWPAVASRRRYGRLKEAGWRPPSAAAISPQGRQPPTRHASSGPAWTTPMRIAPRHAVNYAVKAQDVPPLAFGTRQQRRGPRIAESVGGLIGKGVEVHVVGDD